MNTNQKIIIPQYPDIPEMNKSKFLTIAVVLLLLLNATTLYFLFQKKVDGRRSSHGGGRPYSEFIIKQLKFDTVQAAQLKQLRDQHKLELDELKKQDKQLQEAKFTLLKEGVTDSLKIDSVLTLVAANKKQFEMAFHKHFMEIRSLCRPDQLDLFNKTIDEMKKRRMPPPGDKDKRGDGPPPAK